MLATPQESTHQHLFPFSDGPSGPSFRWRRSQALAHSPHCEPFPEPLRRARLVGPCPAHCETNLRKAVTSGALLPRKAQALENCHSLFLFASRSHSRAGCCCLAEAPPAQGQMCLCVFEQTAEACCRRPQVRGTVRCAGSSKGGGWLGLCLQISQQHRRSSPCVGAARSGGVSLCSHCPYRLVVRTSRRGRDNPGSTPGEDISALRADRPHGTAAPRRRPEAMSPRGYGATAARLTPDQKVGSSNLSALITASSYRSTAKPCVQQRLLAECAVARISQ